MVACRRDLAAWIRQSQQEKVPPRPPPLARRPRAVSHNPLFVFFHSNGFFIISSSVSGAVSYLTVRKSVWRLICHYLPAALLAFARANIPVAMAIASHAGHTYSFGRRRVAEGGGRGVVERERAVGSAASALG